MKEFTSVRDGGDDAGLRANTPLPVWPCGSGSLALSRETQKPALHWATPASVGLLSQRQRMDAPTAKATCRDA